MKKMILGFAAFAAAMAVGMVACDAAHAQTDGKQRDMSEWHSGAYDVVLGTNFASPTGYMRFERQIGGGDSGASGGESGDAGAGSGAGAGGGTGGNGGAGEGCSR